MVKNEIVAIIIQCRLSFRCVVHRDIKPANILLDYSGLVKLGSSIVIIFSICFFFSVKLRSNIVADFGISRHIKREAGFLMIMRSFLFVE